MRVAAGGWPQSPGSGVVGEGWSRGREGLPCMDTVDATLQGDDRRGWFYNGLGPSHPGVESYEC